MHQLDDNALLREFAERGSEPAFAALVARHLNKVHSVALRHTRNPHQAEEITQAVFVLLARKAGELHRHAVLSGWLYQTARLTAVTQIRGDIRRAQREQEALMQTLTNENESELWPQIAPLLDDAMAGLNETDRHAIVLRYFDGQSMKEVGAALGASEDAVKVRVNRAVEKLRKFFTQRGVTLSAAVLTTAISANAVQAAPAGLAAAVTAAALSGAALTTSTVLATTKIIAMTTLQKTLITATVAVLAGAGIYEAKQAANARDEVQTLSQAQAPLAAELEKLRAENKHLANVVTETREQKKLTESQFNELLKLRGQVGQAHTAVQELAKARVAASQQNGTLPAFMTNAIAHGLATAEKFKKKTAVAKVARMKEALHLTDDQAQTVNDIMLKHLDEESQRILQAMSHGQLNDRQSAATISVSEEDEIKAVLNSEQLSGYDAFKHAETLTDATNGANSQVKQMAGDLNLSTEQQNQIRPLLVQNSLDPKWSPDKTAFLQAHSAGNYGTMLEIQMQAQQQRFNQEIKLLEGVLTPEQMQKYKQSASEKNEMANNALKMFMPQTNSVPTQ